MSRRPLVALALALATAVALAPTLRTGVALGQDDAGRARMILGQDGAEMMLVPAGELPMGSAADDVERALAECEAYGVARATCVEWLADEGPRHRVTLDAFYIDRYEVRNVEFDRFVRATSHVTTAEREGWSWALRLADGWRWTRMSGAAWRTPGGPDSAADATHPVVHVSWIDADTYCRWADKRLPTEAEWERAARGTDGRRYPWGDTWNAARANGGMLLRSTKPAGSYPEGASPYGVHDMAGNVAEWVADWFAPDYYGRSPERNPRGPATGRLRVLRGGSWYHLPVLLRAAFRAALAPEGRYANLGFRCARGL